MSASVIDILRSYSINPTTYSGLTKNMRKRRNKKIKHAATYGGAGGVATLLVSRAYTEFIDPKRVGRAKPSAPIEASNKGRIKGVDSSGKGGWGKLPNVAEIHYEDDDARGWTYVGPHKRNRGCKIVDDPDQF